MKENYLVETKDIITIEIDKSTPFHLNCENEKALCESIKFLLKEIVSMGIKELSELFVIKLDNGKKQIVLKSSYDKITDNDFKILFENQ